MSPRPSTKTSRASSSLLLFLVILPAAIAAQSAGARAAGAARGATQSESNGIRVGDDVEVLTGFGWTPAKVTAISGNSYRVSVSGVQVTKFYPSELRRLGAATAQDHANGQYRLGDPVQVNVQGTWMAGKVITTMGTEYQIEVSGNRTTWADATNLRPGTAPAAPAAPRAGTPPRAGLASCAGKFDGRWATTGAGMGSFTVRFAAGKATMIDQLGNSEVFECWTGGGKVLLRQPGSPNMDMDIDINDDGTLQTPIGEIKRKGT
jgi:hypothetical protein